MYEKLLEQLYYIPRSITGKNNRKSLRIIKNFIPIKIKSIKSGTRIFDWKVPKEWIVSEAWIKNNEGEKIIDFSKCHLNLINYSYPINQILNFKQLQKYLIISKSKDPDSIPYRTAYYKKQVGFCVSKNQFLKIKEKKNKKFHIFINSKFNSGKLDYAEMIIKGKSKKEILISSYFCHPNQANDSLSGIIMGIKLAKYLQKRKNNFSYRIIFIPETIGALCFIKKNLKLFKNKLFAGIIPTTCAGRGPIGIKYSFDKSHIINKLLDNIINKKKIIRYNFSIRGSDERQYSSPGTRLNTVSIFKDKYFDYKEYHSSKDDLNFVKIKNLNETYKYYVLLIKKLETLNIYERTVQNGEPMMQKYNLYHASGGTYLPGRFKNFDHILECLFYTDGKKTIDEISAEIGISKNALNRIYKMLKSKKLVKKIL